ncbi:MAG TPA: GNAT family N-acetyltransferase, partial [Ktedonobacterales bacterium]|nr:GNAT family N-acetyltransferase [Ktedonobacterales bacterium]
HSTNLYLNYAIPDHSAMPTAEEIAALVTAFQERGRTPHLEFLPTIAPDVEAALMVAGFTVEKRMPLMVCPSGARLDLSMPEGIELIIPTSDSEIMALLTVQNEAYGDPPPDAASLQRRKAFHAAGGSAILARDKATGEPVGGGISDLPIVGVTELAGVGVRPPFRRRGIATAVTTRLVRDAIAAGISKVFLMAEGDAEARIYRRVGFVDCGEVLGISQR